MAFVGRLSGSDAHPYMDKLVVPVTGAIAFESSIAAYQGHAPLIAAVDDGTRVALSCSVAFSASALWVNGSEVTSGGGGGSGNVTMDSNTTVDNIIVITNGTGDKKVQEANAAMSTGGNALTVSGSSGILMKVQGAAQAAQPTKHILVVSGSDQSTAVFGVGMGVATPGKNQLTIVGSVSASSGLFLGGEALFADTVRASGSLVVGGTADVAGLISGSSGLHIGHDALIAGDCRVSGTIHAAGEIEAAGGINLSAGSLTITSSAQLGPNHGIEGLAGTFFGVYGATNYNAGAAALLVVSGGHGASDQWGVGIGVHAPSNARLEVAGLISGSSGLHIGQESLFADTIRTSGSLVVKGPANVAGLISGSSGLHIGHEALFADTVRTSGSLVVGGTAIVGGLISGSSGLHIGHEALFADTIRTSGSLVVAGPVYTTKIRTIDDTTVTALDANDYLVLLDGSPGGPQTVALPTASAVTGQTIIVKRTSDQNVTIWAHGGSIDGYSNTGALSGDPGGVVTFISNGTTWLQIQGVE